MQGTRHQGEYEGTIASGTIGRLFEALSGPVLSVSGHTSREGRPARGLKENGPQSRNLEPISGTHPLAIRPASRRGTVLGNYPTAASEEGPFRRALRICGPCVRPGIGLSATDWDMLTHEVGGHAAVRSDACSQRQPGSHWNTVNPPRSPC